MEEIALHILDIVQNSIYANATFIKVVIIEQPVQNIFSFSVWDNGKGMTKDFVEQVKNPFHTTRTTRKVGLGIPLLDLTCQQCNGKLKIKSQVGKGTMLKAKMDYDHIDRPPLGDMPSTIVSILLSLKNQHFYYEHQYMDQKFKLDTQELQEILGEISLQEPTVLQWIHKYVEEGLIEIKQRIFK